MEELDPVAVAFQQCHRIGADVGGESGVDLDTDAVGVFEEDVERGALVDGGELEGVVVVVQRGAAVGADRVV